MKRIIILGPNLEDINVKQVAEYRQVASYLLGDGKKNISIKDLAEVTIDGKIRIDFRAHGTFIGGEIPQELRLSIGEVVPIKKIFEEFNQVFQGLPLYIHIWSCFGGLAHNNIDSLPEKSVLVTHARSLKESIPELGGIVTDKIECTNPFQDFLNHLPRETYQTSKLSIKIKEGVYSFELAPSLCEVLKNPIEALNKVHQDFIKFCSNLSDKGCDIGTLVIKEFPPKEIDNYIKGYFIYNCYIGNNDGITEALEPLTSEAKSKLLNCTLKGATPLGMSCLGGNKDLVLYLIENRVETQKTYCQGLASIHISAQKGHTEILKALLKYDKSLLDLLTEEGDTALHIGAEHGQIEVVKALLEYKAQKLPNKAGYFPIHLACIKNNIEVVKTLVEDDHDSLKRLTKKEAATPKQIAFVNDDDDLTKLLLDYEATYIDHRNPDEEYYHEQLGLLPLLPKNLS